MNEHESSCDAALARYRIVERQCERMLEAARDDDWNDVGVIAGELQALIAAIRVEASATELAARERSEKFRILRNIVRLDAQIRHLANPWQRSLDTMLGHRSAAARGGPLAA